MRLNSLRSSFAVLLSTLMSLAVMLTTACTVGETAASDEDLTTFVDSDGDGVSDSVDTDGDGESDFSIENCTFCEPQARPICRAPLIDENRDGIPDGIDTNCDGTIDRRFGTTTTAGSGGGGSCLANANVNGTKFTVSCQAGNCQCKRNDQLVQSCTQAANVCSLSARNGQVTAGCCVF
jgi:hypothetical protein